MTEQMIGILGWLDTPLPTIVHVLFGLLTLVVLAGVVASRDRRLILATALVVAALLVVPIAINVISAPTAGPIWQGRYSLPMYAAFGVLGHAGVAAGAGPHRRRRRSSSAVCAYGACAVFVGHRGRRLLAGAPPLHRRFARQDLVDRTAAVATRRGAHAADRDQRRSPSSDCAR